MAVVSHATLLTQRQVFATLATIADAALAANIEAPALVIVVSHRTVSVEARLRPENPAAEGNSRTR